MMRVTLPYREEYEEIFIHLPPIFKVKRTSERLEIECPLELEISRLTTGLKQREFSKFFKEIEVQGGKKKKDGDFIILKPLRPTVFPLRFAETELNIIKEAAAKTGVSVAEYCRRACITKAYEDLYAAAKRRE